ncbi:glycosyltransferase [Streptomyces sp. NPDC006296]|uniref:glycosyltransferase n=1 Tax=Streptomyces sp. NPDC006296 TaxID=3156746 RepID=UPI0033ACB88D
MRDPTAARRWLPSVHRPDRWDSMARIVLISPPFLSHAQPLSVLAHALTRQGAEVHFACTEDFAGLAERAGAAFVPLAVTRNANTGVAEATAQGAAERTRLREFLEATRAGAVPTLVTQAAHRRQDMLADPDLVLARLRAVDERLRPDWYVVDQLSYAATLALHTLGLPYASFCPGHPGYVLSGADAYFGVPYAWPRALRPEPAQEAVLTEAARSNDEAFTALFADFVRRHAPSQPPPGRAFALTSPHAVVYSYPELPWLPAAPPGPGRLFAGHMTDQAPPLDEQWRDRLRRLRERGDRVVLVALGTFLSARDDVLRTVTASVLESLPDTSLVIAAGDRAAALADLSGERAVIASVVPQRSLLDQVDAMVHHGGNNSFTESVRAGVPAVVLPFSSDQFAVAHDAERARAGVVLDPNALTRDGIAEAVHALPETSGAAVSALSRQVRDRGPDWAAGHLLAAMEKLPGRE